MKLSVVIPAFNEEARIGKCLESIVREIDANDIIGEIIVVDNASTDHTAEIAQKYKGVRVVLEPKKGITFARERGHREAVGDLVANIDADNLMPPGWVVRVMDEFKKNPRLVCLSGPLYYYDASLWVRAWVRAFYIVGFLFYLVNRFVLRIGSMVQGGNFIVRKSALDKIGGFNTGIKFYGEDTDIARRMHSLGDVKFTFALPIWSSGRRLRKDGVIRTAWRYTINYVSVIFRGTAREYEAKDIR